MRYLKEIALFGGIAAYQLGNIVGYLHRISQLDKEGHESLKTASNLMERAVDATLASSPYEPLTREQIAKIQIDAMNEAMPYLVSAAEKNPHQPFLHGIVASVQSHASDLASKSGELTYKGLETIANNLSDHINTIAPYLAQNITIDHVAIGVAGAIASALPVVIYTANYLKSRDK